MWKRVCLAAALLKEISGRVNMLLPLFMERFQGCWNNQRQAYGNPRGQAFVHVIHEFDVDRYLCSYRYRRQKNPYRYFEATVHDNDGRIVLKNPVHDIEFYVQNGCFVTKSDFINRGIRYINEAYLGEKYYHVKDQGFDLKSGKQLWGLDGDEFYEFDRS